MLSPPSAARTRTLIAAMAALAAISAGVLVSPTGVIATLDSLTTDPFLFGLLVAALYLARPFLAWPTTPLAVVVGYGYGVAAGVPVALAGVLVTVLPVYAAARWATATDGSSVGAGRVAALLEGTGRSVTRYYDATGPIRGVTVSRLLPIPSDVATVAAATSGVRTRHLLVGTAVGELPWTVAGVVVGASAATATTEGLGELGVALTAVCLLAAAVLLAEPAARIRRRGDERASEARRPTDD